MNDGSTTRFVFNLDSTPEIDVTGNFRIDGSGTMELDVTGGITMTEGGDAQSSTVLRPTGHYGQPALMMQDRIEYLRASGSADNVSESSGANDDVWFLPISGHHNPDEDDDLEHHLFAPTNGRLLAVIMSSNNPLHKQSTNEWISKCQLLSTSSTGSNAFGGSVDNFDTRVTGVDADGNSTGVNEITGIPPVNGTWTKVVYNFAESGKFALTAGNTYAIVWRLTNFASGQTSKSHSLNITYVIAWDETTSSTSFGGWTGY